MITGASTLIIDQDTHSSLVTLQTAPSDVALTLRLARGEKDNSLPVPWTVNGIFKPVDANRLEVKITWGHLRAWAEATGQDLDAIHSARVKPLYELLEWLRLSGQVAL